MENTMPIISMFYGIIIYMYPLDTKQHSMPHIHVEYSGMSAVFSLLDGEILAGELPPKKIRLVQAWMDIHAEELEADWRIAVQGGEVFRIEPLR
jgi:hypothetical protein